MSNQFPQIPFPNPADPQSIFSCLFAMKQTLDILINATKVNSPTTTGITKAIYNPRIFIQTGKPAGDQAQLGDFWLNKNNNTLWVFTNPTVNTGFPSAQAAITYANQGWMKIAAPTPTLTDAGQAIATVNNEMIRLGHN